MNEHCREQSEVKDEERHHDGAPGSHSQPAASRSNSAGATANDPAVSAVRVFAVPIPTKQEST